MSLRRAYADIVAEGAPERFAAIVRRLDEPSNGGLDRRTGATGCSYIAGAERT